MQDKTSKCKKCQILYRFKSTGCDLCKKCVKKYPYFLSFVAEGVMGVVDKVFGRVEVYANNKPTGWAVDELRFLFKADLSKEKAFYGFREKWDFQNVSKKELEAIQKILKNNYYEV